MIQALTDYYRSQGYLDFNVSEYKFIETKGIFDTDKTTLLIDIESGPEYYVEDVSFDGNYIFNDSIIKSQIKFNSEDTFNGMQFDISNMNLSNLYRDEGYLFSQINPSIIPILSPSVSDGMYISSLFYFHFILFNIFNIANSI